MSAKLITEETMGQFAEVKRTRVCNMFDYNRVMNEASRLKLEDLASLSMEQYGKLLMNAEERRTWATKMLIKRKGKDPRFKVIWM